MLGATCSSKNWEERNNYEVSKTYHLGVKYSDRSTCYLTSKMENDFQIAMGLLAASGAIFIFFVCLFGRQAKDTIISCCRKFFVNNTFTVMPSCDSISPPQRAGERRVDMQQMVFSGLPAHTQT